MRISQILQTKGRDVATVAPTTPVLEVAAMLRDKRIGAVVVMDSAEKIMGIASERDIVRALPEHGSEFLGMTISELMTADVVTCTPMSGVNDIMRMMTRGRFRHVPVLEEGRLLGIVSIGDLVKARIEELEHEKEALESYVKS